MYVSCFLNLRSLGLFILALVLVAITFESATAYAFSERQAGVGSETISGFKVTNVSYEINGDGDPTTLDKVMFKVQGSDHVAPTKVHVKLVSSNKVWFSCSAGSSTQWSCDTTGTIVKISDMDELSVIATR